jgi:hypothetical protein
MEVVMMAVNGAIVHHLRRRNEWDTSVQCLVQDMLG